MCNKIPKKIHYCWFGGNPKNELICSCIDTWKKYLPEYEFIEWNEESFDIDSNEFAKQAYENKKWAFVTDYVRLYAVYNYGGIYLDTDVEIKHNLDQFLKHSAFTGFESKNTPFTAVFGAERHSKWVKDMLDIYNDIEFIDKNGDLVLTTNTMHVSRLMIEKYGVKLNNKYQVLSNDLHLYPNYYFCRPSNSRKTYAIHHCNGSWITGNKKNIRDFVKRILGNNMALKIMDIKSNLEFLFNIKSHNNKEGL